MLRNKARQLPAEPKRLLFLLYNTIYHVHVTKKDGFSRKIAEKLLNIILYDLLFFDLLGGDMLS